MRFTSIALALDGHLATITLNRPEKMNALDDAILLELQAAFRQIESDLTVRAVILTGAGRAFSAGFDLSAREVPFSSVEDWRGHVKLGNDTWMQIWRSRLPVIAAVNGYCLGGGCELSMVCDITLAADDAQFGEPEIQFNSSPPFAIMPWVLGMKKTKELLLTGERIGAVEAERIGLVNRVVPAAELMAEAVKLGRKLCKVPPPAMNLNKTNLNRAYDMRGLQSTIDYGAEIFALVLLSKSEESEAFFKVVAQRGLAKAFKWRDALFDTPR